MNNFDYKKYLAEGFLGHPSERESKRDFKRQFPKSKGSSSQDQDFGHPDNIVSVVDDMTLTMGEDAFIAAVFKALPLEDVKRILRGITNDNPISNELGPVTYDWLNENDPFYKSDSYLDDPKPQRLGPSSQFTFEPSDPKKDLMIHTIVDEYQEKIFDYLWNYELYRNEYLKEDINYDEFDEKPEEIAQTIDPEDLTYPLEYAMAWEGFDDLDDITTIKQFNDLIKAMKKTREVPAKFFDLKEKEQMGIIRQAVMYI